MKKDKKPLTMSLMQEAYSMYSRFFDGVPLSVALGKEDYEKYDSLLLGPPNDGNSILHYRGIPVKIKENNGNT